MSSYSSLICTPIGAFRKSNDKAKSTFNRALIAVLTHISFALGLVENARSVDLVLVRLKLTNMQFMSQ